MDAARGVLCCGPEGPDPILPWKGLGIKSLPVSVDILQEETFFRFLINLKSKQVDLNFIEALYSGRQSCVVGTTILQPTVISTLTNVSISVANHVWEARDDCLSDRTCLENGLTR